jgi:quinol monooxygenase YgiN
VKIEDQLAGETEASEGHMLNMVVTQRVNAGMEKEFEALAKQMAANTLAQDKGCVRYEWYRAETPQTYILIESWTDMAAVEAHLKADHFVALWPKLTACVPEKFSAVRMTPID